MVERWVAQVDLPPDVFAVVMATGIVAIAADDHGYHRISDVLAAIASIVFVVLVAALALRILHRRGILVAELRDPDAALRMFTFVAAACVLGVVWRRYPGAVWAMAVLALAGWAFLIPMGLRDVLSRPHADLRDHARGAWLLVSVATSGMAITAADLAVIHSSAWLSVVGLAWWLIALLLYCAVTYLIAARTVAGGLRQEVLTPDSWILMGALAIAALAGNHLVDAADAAGAAAPWIAHLTVVLWVCASLWIPVLLLTTIWRVDRHPGSLRLAGAWWSAVFPLGMYSSATAATGSDLDMPALTTISLVFCWIAITVWLVVGLGSAQAAGTRWRTRHPPAR